MTTRQRLHRNTSPARHPAAALTRRLPAAPLLLAALALLAVLFVGAPPAQAQSTSVVKFVKDQGVIEETNTHSAALKGRAGSLIVRVSIDPPLAQRSSVKVTMTNTATHTVDFFVLR